MISSLSILSPRKIVFQKNRVFVNFNFLDLYNYDYLKNKKRWRDYSPRASLIYSTISEGFLATFTPAAAKASILLFAVPELPAMIAPA